MPWSAPKINVGDPVLWHPEPGDVGVPAIVTRLSSRDGRMIDVCVISGRSTMPRSAIRHEDDPALAKMEQNDAGTWSLTKSASDVQARLSFLESQIAGLKKKV